LSVFRRPRPIGFQAFSSARRRATRAAACASSPAASASPTTDVLSELGARRKNGQLLVGFAADRGERGLERAREKLANKRADLIVFNDVARDDVGFDALDNEVVLISSEGERRIEKAPKERIAAVILDEVAGRLEEANGRSGR
jgi:phosphopantothenoylcysteine decarboxylase/phosphopantothenate--cysteine ligase